MGCWDIFCFACGNTCHTMFKDQVEEIGEIYKEYVESLNESSKKPKLGPYYKKLFGQISSDPKFFLKMKNLYKKTQWLNKCTFLTVDDRTIHGCKEIGCNIEFEDSKGNGYFQDLNTGIYGDDLSIKTSRGIFIHTDCWKYIKSHYKIDLKYSDVPAVYEKNQYKKINSKIDYGLIEKYWTQDFDFIQVVLDSNEYICESPFSNNKNETRIKKILTQFKLNTDPKRTGPSVSATFYPESTIKYGLDKGLWIKSGGKWLKLKEPTVSASILVDFNKLDKKLSNYLKKIVCVGEPSDIPIFIVSMKYDKKKFIRINFIGTEEQVNKLV